MSNVKTLSNMKTSDNTRNTKNTSNVKTLRDVETESEMYEVSKKELDVKMGSMKKKINELIYEIEEAEAKDKSSVRQLEMYMRALNDMKTERDLLRKRNEELNNIIESKKNKQIHKISDVENVFYDDKEKEKKVDEIYKNKYEQKDKELEKYLKDLLK
jgi:predicted GNAT family acetyltransferase